jgi:hypothetical protein
MVGWLPCHMGASEGHAGIFAIEYDTPNFNGTPLEVLPNGRKRLGLCCLESQELLQWDSSPALGRMANLK